MNPLEYENFRTAITTTKWADTLAMWYALRTLSSIERAAKARTNQELDLARFHIDQAKQWMKEAEQCMNSGTRFN